MLASLVRGKGGKSGRAAATLFKRWLSLFAAVAEADVVAAVEVAAVGGEGIFGNSVVVVVRLFFYNINN